MKRKILMAAAVLAIAFTAGTAQAQSEEELAAESEAACAASAKVKATPEMVVKKVEEAAAMLEKEGRAGLRKLQGKNSPYIFAGTYIWVHDMDGLMVMHPIKYKMNGKSLLTQRDAAGKRFYLAMNKVAREKGAGWAAYMWPKPGEKKASQKVSYLRRVKIGGKDMVLGCGIYDVPPEEMSKLHPE